MLLSVIKACIRYERRMCHDVHSRVQAIDFVFRSVDLWVESIFLYSITFQMHSIRLYFLDIQKVLKLIHPSVISYGDFMVLDPAHMNMARSYIKLKTPGLLFVLEKK